jgi:hypothetical protein
MPGGGPAPCEPSSCLIRCKRSKPLSARGFCHALKIRRRTVGTNRPKLQVISISVQYLFSLRVKGIIISYTPISCSVENRGITVNYQSRRVSLHADPSCFRHRILEQRRVNDPDLSTGTTKDMKDRSNMPAPLNLTCGIITCRHTQTAINPHLFGL